MYQNSKFNIKEVIINMYVVFLALFMIFNITNLLEASNDDCEISITVQERSSVLTLQDLPYELIGKISQELYQKDFQNFYISSKILKNKIDQSPHLFIPLQDHAQLLEYIKELSSPDIVNIATRSPKKKLFEELELLKNNQFIESSNYFDVEDMINDKWTIYVKLSYILMALKDEKAKKDLLSISDQKIHSFMQTWTCYSNEPDDETKNSLIYLWWQCALVDKEKRESLIDSLNKGSNIIKFDPKKAEDLKDLIISILIIKN